MSTLISLVGHENMPNIIAAIALKPDRLAFLVTEAFAETSYPHLCNLLRKKLPKLNAIWDYHVDAYSIESAKRACGKAIIESGQDVTVNITGGTKLMSIGAYQAALEHNCPAVYVETNQRKILYQHNPDGAADIPFPAKALRIDDCLAAQGKMARASRNYTAFELRSSRQLALRARAMNQLATKIRSAANKRLRQIEWNNISGEVRHLIDILDSQGLIQIITSHGRYRKFSVSSDFEQWLGGRWLEAYVYDTAVQCGFDTQTTQPKGFDDVQTGVEIFFGSTRVGNEIDVLIEHNTRLTIISCKTGRMDTNHLSELVTLADEAGGLFANAIVVTSTVPGPLFKKRAQILKIKVFGIYELPSLEEKLKIIIR